MSVSIEVEDLSWLTLPGLERFTCEAVDAALSGAGHAGADSEIAVLFTGDAEISSMNAEWRGKEGPTNVLSFPTPIGTPVPAGEPRPLGDIVLAHGVITREAQEQGKSLHDHTAHLIVHGVLHLLGFDHDTDAEACQMEQLETRILKGLGISDPYE